MGKVVQINPGFGPVTLPPNSLYFNAGQQTTLTDAEYSALTTSTTRALTVISNVADPVRNPTANPISLSDAVTQAVSLAVAQAKTYTDTQLARGGTDTQTGSVTLTSTSHDFQICDATNGAFSITLPTGVAADTLFTFIKSDSTTNAVTLVGTFNTQTNYSLATQWKTVTIRSTGSNAWYIVANN